MNGHWIRTNRVVREAKPAMSRIERHAHEFCYLVYCVDGLSRVLVHGEFVDIGKNDVLLIPPHVEHAFYITDRFVSIEAKFYCDADLESNLSRSPYLIHRGDMIASRIMRDIIDEALKQDDYYEDIINAKLLFLMLSLMRRTKASGSALPDDFRYRYLISNGNDAWLSAVVAYIEDNIKNPLSVRIVAQHFGYESGYFSGVFKEHASCSLLQYIAERKCDAAKEMLMEGRSVTDVAQILGYSSIHHFSRRFKAMVGVPPGEFSERIRVQLAVNVSGDKSFPPSGEFEYHPKPWDGENYI